jgi:hypothetical protein
VQGIDPYLRLTAQVELLEEKKATQSLDKTCILLSALPEEKGQASEQQCEERSG